MIRPPRPSKFFSTNPIRPKRKRRNEHGWGNALELASRITHPYAVAAFTAVLVTFVLWRALHAKKPAVARLLAAVLLVLGTFPSVAKIILASRGNCHILLLYSGPTDSRDQANVSSSAGGEISGGTEIKNSTSATIQTVWRPIIFYASVKDEFLEGTSSLALRELLSFCDDPTSDIAVGQHPRDRRRRAWQIPFPARASRSRAIPISP